MNTLANTAPPPLLPSILVRLLHNPIILHFSWSLPRYRLYLLQSVSCSVCLNITKGTTDDRASRGAPFYVRLKSIYQTDDRVHRVPASLRRYVRFSIHAEGPTSSTRRRTVRYASFRAWTRERLAALDPSVMTSQQPETR